MQYLPQNLSFQSNYTNPQSDFAPYIFLFLDLILGHKNNPQIKQTTMILAAKKFTKAETMAAPTEPNDGIKIVFRPNVTITENTTTNKLVPTFR